MGYGPTYFSAHVANWLHNGWLPEGGRIIDFGAQDFSGDLESARGDVQAFLAQRGARLSGPLSVAGVYRAVGIDYLSIDVDGQFGSHFFDLNTFGVRSELRGTFDFVNNEGTIEHLVNPINGFEVAHELAKVGGVVRHSMPFQGWSYHGFFYPTAKFLTELIAANRYHVLEARLEPGQGNLALENRLFGRVNFPSTDVWFHLTYRKKRDAHFRVPADHLNFPEAASVSSLLASNWRGYSARRFTGDTPEPPAFDVDAHRLRVRALALNTLRPLLVALRRAVRRT